jgi:hypothetical protein
MNVSRDQWLSWIVEAAGHIASREYQEQSWFPGGKYQSSPDEVYLTLMEDRVFDRFFELYGSTFTDQQTKSWTELRQKLETYYDSLPKHPDPRAVIEDPSWEEVRDASRMFVEAFTPKTEDARKGMD